jgi:hypothetical protein
MHIPPQPAEPSVQRPEPSPNAGAGCRCENCGADLAGPFCHLCGQAAESPLISVRAFTRGIVADVANLDGKAVRTARLLFTRPGALTAEYLYGRRVRYMSPVQVYLAAVALFFLTNAYRPFVSVDVATRRIVTSLNAAAVSGSISREKLAELARQGTPLTLYRERFEGAITGWMPTFLIGSVVLFALALGLFFRRQRHGYVGHLVLALHWTAFFLLLMIVDRLLPAHGRNSSPVGVALFVIAVTYLVLALRRVYARSWPATLAKGILLFLVFQVLLVAWMFSAIAFAFTVA